MMTNLLIIVLLWSSGQCRGARRRSSNSVQRTEWPANRYAAGTEAECPPSCPTRDLRDARPAARGALTLNLWRCHDADVLDEIRRQCAAAEARSLAVDPSVAARLPRPERPAAADARCLGDGCFL